MELEESLAIAEQEQDWEYERYMKYIVRFGREELEKFWQMMGYAVMDEDEPDEAELKVGIS